QQITSSVNNPSEAMRFYQSGDLIPLLAFTSQRLPMFPHVPTLWDVGGEFHYFMPITVAGAPGMRPEAQAYYTQRFQSIFNSAPWQTYKAQNSLVGSFLAGDRLRSYWSTQRARHESILRASGAIK
ncbi:MAG: tripartite tricarboxylate transporter substrate binding protein, partial [Pseudomonadota bacterium]